MAVPISNVTRRVVFSPSGTGPYAFTFEILAETDIEVYKGDTKLTLTTDYSVTINANGTGSVTLVSTAGTDNITIIGARAIQRLSDFVTGGDFFANTVNDELDSLTIFAQQNSEAVSRALQAPETDPTTINMTLPRAATRANKTLAFDSSGNPVIGEIIGDNRGNWAASTSYNKRDIVKDTSNNNIYLANTAHTSSGSQPISSNADSAKWDLLVDAAAAASSATAAAASASAASTSASNASTSASNAATSATNASNSASGASTSATNASNSATAAASSASAASASASAASTSETNAAASESAAATSASNASSSASAASTSASNASTSATNAASSASDASTSASNAATSATNAANSATAAAGSATAAAASEANAASSETAAQSAQSAAESARDATLAAYDSFDDRYLGAKSSEPTLDNDGNALVAGSLYFNTVSESMRLYTGSAWVAAYAAGSDFVTTTGSAMTGDLDFGDNVKATFGADEDLWIYHDGGSSNIFERGTGNLRIITNSTVNIDGASGGEFMAQFVSNGAVTLYYDNSSRLVTTTDGVDVLGTGSLRLPNGTTLQRPSSPSAGDIRWNTTDGSTEVYDGSAWGSVGGGGGGGGGGGTSVTVTQATATASQTTFSVTYTVGQLSVYLNGALLSSSDYTASNGTSVVLASGAASGDIFTAVAYDSATQITVGDSKVEVTDTGSDGTITFDTDGSERMRINNAGNVGIGVTPSAWNSAQRALQVGATGVIYGTSGDVYFGNNIFVNSSDSNTYITTDEATVYRQVNNSHIWYGAASGTAGASITLTERMRINAGSNILCLAGGNTSATGTGITFPATQSASADANTLDDYEEGTWTPSDQSGAGLTLTNAEGKYVKIGRQVTAWGWVLYPSTASGTNNQLGGLPFSIANSNPDRGGGMIGFKTDSTVVTLRGENNGTFLQFKDSTGGNISNATLSTDQFFFAITYQTA